jgi:WD40 repeat protein
LLVLPGSLLAQDKVSTHTDLFGDPLPEGAVARFGTLHWRHGTRVTSVAFTNDGKELLTTCGDGLFHVWDAVSGKELRRFGDEHRADQGVETISRRRPYVDPRSLPIAVTDDGKLLAAATSDAKISLWDVAAGKELRSFPHEQQALCGLSFTPKGKNLITRGVVDRTFKVWDPSTGKMIRSFDENSNDELNFKQKGGFFNGNSLPMAVSPDGKYLAYCGMVFGKNGWNSGLYIWDLNDGKPVKTVEEGAGGGFQQQAGFLTFSPDSKSVAYSRFDGTNQIVEANSGKVVAKFGDNADPPIVCAVYLADGKTLAAMRTDNQIDLVDVSTGKRSKTIGEEPDGPNGKGMAKAMRQVIINNGMTTARSLALSADGKKLAQAWTNVVRIWDLETGKGNDLAGGHCGEIQHLMVSSDGKTLFTAGVDATIRAWNGTSAKEERRIDLPPTTSRSLIVNTRQAVVGDSGNDIRVWDLVSGKEARKLDATGVDAPVVMYAASADARTLAISSGDCSIRLFDLESGKETNTLRNLVSDNSNPFGRHYLYALDCTPDGTAVGIEFQSNEMVAQPGGGFGYNTKHTIRLQDADSGAVLWETETPMSCRGFQFSPDGHNLAVVRADGTTTAILEGATGKERCHVDGNGVMPVFSDDGRFLALGGAKGEIKVFDVRHSKEIANFKGHEGRVAALGFSPDAKMLYTGGAEGSALAWDIHQQVQQATKKTELDSEAAKRAVSDLGGDDAAKAFAAIASLSASPRTSVELLKDQLKPAQGEDAAIIARLISQLDSEEFAQRRKAFETLSKMGSQAHSALKKTLAEPSSLEVCHAAKELLELTAPGRLTPELVKQIRALEVLESAATPEAKRVIEALAKGAPGNRLTQEAQAALHRLDR